MSDKVRNEPKRTWAEHGFSLIEAVVVTMIILVLAAISTPALYRFIRNYQIRGATAELAAEMQRARMQAVMKNVRYGVSLAVINAREYRVVVEDVQIPCAKAAGLYVNAGSDLTAAAAGCATDAEKRQVAAQIGPIRMLPGRVVFGPHCPGFAANAEGVRFNRTGLTCQPTGGATPRTPGDCAGLSSVALLNLVSFNASGDATFCLADTGRGLARQVVVNQGGRVRVEDVAFNP